MSIMPEPITVGSIFGLIQKAIGWISKIVSQLEIWWMNVRIVSPGHLDQVKAGKVEVKGTYRTTLGKTLVLFHRVDNNYWPQGLLAMGAGGRWRGSVFINSSDGLQNIVIAVSSTDLDVLMEYYAKVKKETDRYVGIRMQKLPPGLNVVCQTQVHGK
jgi:hypothetical protein